MENLEILKSIVMDRENMAVFSHAIAGVLYYEVSSVDNHLYQFPIDMNDRDDVGTTTFPSQIKAVTLMRYIRKAIDKSAIIKIH